MDQIITGLIFFQLIMTALLGVRQSYAAILVRHSLYTSVQCVSVGPGICMDAVNAWPSHRAASPMTVFTLAAVHQPLLIGVWQAFESVVYTVKHLQMYRRCQDGCMLHYHGCPAQKAREDDCMFRGHGDPACDAYLACRPQSCCPSPSGCASPAASCSGGPWSSCLCVRLWTWTSMTRYPRAHSWQLPGWTMLGVACHVGQMVCSGTRRCLQVSALVGDAVGGVVCATTISLAAIVPQQPVVSAGHRACCRVASLLMQQPEHLTS